MKDDFSHLHSIWQFAKPLSINHLFDPQKSSVKYKTGLVITVLEKWLQLWNGDNAYIAVYFSFLFFLRSSHSVSQSGVQWHDLGSLQPQLLGSSNSPASAFWIAESTGARHHTWLIFVFLVETGLLHVGQDGLDLLTLWSTCLRIPKYRDYRREPPHLAIDYFLYLSLFIFEYSGSDV